MQGRQLSEELRDWIKAIEAIVSSHGLDPFPTIFEMVTYEQMNMLAAYQGFPVRYRHWRWGMDYERLSKSYEWGLHKIYEMVINTNPCYAYLLEGNSLLDQKLVISHVYAHSDFFKNNGWFARTDRKMLDRMASNAARVGRIADRHGPEKVEDFIDVCLSVDNLIDTHSPYILRRGDSPDEDDLPPEPTKLPARSYMDRYINPEEDLAAQREAMRVEWEEMKLRIPPEPERDVLLFLLEHAPLTRWQQAILSIIREEAYYFAPQMMTKILNEGWASYWHAKIMTEDVCDDADIVDFACCHAGTMAMSPYSINPYKIGLELFRSIEQRWNTGRFGLEYERCDHMETKLRWDRELGEGRQKIYQVRKIYNDVTFIDEFFTPEFCAEQKMFTFAHNRRSDSWEVKSREFYEIKAKLLGQLTNFGQPSIYVEDGNYKNRGELLLWHRHDGQDLKPDEARETLCNLAKIWKRPVHVRTESDGKPLIWSHDGETFDEAAG